ETSVNVETKESKHSHGKKRKYNEIYLQCRFTFIEINDEQRPICVICSEHSANESMKPAKLKRHLHTNHPSCASKPVEYFEWLLQSKKQQSNSEAHVLTNSKYLRASFEASYIIAKTKQPFTIGEGLALPIAIRNTVIINGEK
ncbi:hypothetical protein FHG87_007398, partial [Trinorchestia longiramus]